MNLPLRAIRLWLCSASRYNPQIMCVSSFVKSDQPQSIKWMHEFITTHDKEAKQSDMLSVNCNTFNGGIFIELVDREQEQWEEPDFTYETIVFEQKNQACVEKEIEVMEYLMKHLYQARHTSINTEVQLYTFASLKGNKLNWSQEEEKEEEEEKKIEEEKSRECFEFNFDQHNQISKIGPNTPKTESGGPSPPLIGNMEMSVGGGFTPRDKEEKCESVLGEMGEADAPSPNLSPVNNNQNEQEQENITPITEEGLKSISQSTQLRARKQRQFEEHKQLRDQHHSISIFRRQTKAKLIFIKFFINCRLSLNDVRGMTFPFYSSPYPIRAKEVFRRYIRQFEEALYSVNFQRPARLDIRVFKETRMKDVLANLNEIYPTEEVDLRSCIYNQNIENGDCYIIACSDQSDPFSPSFSSLNQYLLNDILNVQVQLVYKPRKFQTFILQDRWMQSLRQFDDCQYAKPFILDVKLNTPLIELAQRLQNQRFIHTPHFTNRVYFYRVKETFETAGIFNPENITNSAKREGKVLNDKLKEVYDLRRFTIREVLISSSEHLLFNVLPFPRRELAQRSSLQIHTILVSSLTNQPYLVREMLYIQEVKASSAEQTFEYHQQYTEEKQRKAYESLLVATIWQSDCVANEVEIRKFSACTAGDLKEEVFKILTEQVSLLGRANAYARNKKLPIRFKKSLELKSVSQLLVLREAALKNETKNLNITERVVMKIFQDEQKVWMPSSEKKLISELNSNIRVLIVPIQSPLWPNLEHNLWPSKYPQFPVSPRLREALEDVLEEKKEPIDQNSLSDSHVDQYKLRQYFTLKFEYQKCFLVQCRVVLEDSTKLLSDIFLLSCKTDAASVSSFLWSLSSEGAPDIKFRNKTNNLRVLSHHELLNSVSYQIVRYKLANPDNFKPIVAASIFAPKKQDDPHKKPFFIRAGTTILALRHQGEKKDIGKKVEDKKILFKPVMRGIGCTLKQAFSGQGALKSFVPSPVVLEIVIGKELY